MTRKNLSWPKRILNWRLFIFINLSVLILLIVNVGREWIQSQEARNELADLKKEAERLTKRSTELQDIISKLQSISFLEEEARLRLGLVRPGETSVVVRILERETKSEMAKQKNNPQKWWSYFFKDEF